jgi:hypothetical protein
MHHCHVSSVLAMGCHASCLILPAFFDLSFHFNKWVVLVCLFVGILATFFYLASYISDTFSAFVGCRQMEEDQSALLVSEGAIKSIKLSLSTGEEIVSYPKLMFFPVILSYRYA